MTIYIIIFYFFLIGFYGKIVTRNKKEILLDEEIEEKIDNIYDSYKNIKLIKMIDSFNLFFLILLIISIILVYFYNLKDFEISIYITLFKLIRDFYVDRAFIDGFRSGLRETLIRKTN